MLRKWFGVKRVRVDLLFMIAGFLFTLFFIVKVYPVAFHSDSATADLLAREQVFTGKFFPDDWYYGQDVWVVFINNLIVFLQPLFNNALHAHAVAVIIQSILLAMVTWALVKKMGISQVPLLLSIVFCGVSPYFMDMIFGEAPYGNTILWISLCLYLSMSTFKHKHQHLMLLFLGIVLILLGMTGVRYISSLSIPLLMALALYALIEANNSSKDEPSPGQLFRLAVVILCAMTVGYLINHIIVQEIHFIKGATDARFTDSSSIVSNLGSTFLAFMELFGALPQAGQPLVSLHGALSAYRLALMFLIVFIAPIQTTIRYRHIDNRCLRLFVLFYWANWAVTVYVYIFSGYASSLDNSRYLLSIVFYSFILFVYYFSSVIQVKGRRLAATFLLGLIPFYLSSYWYYNVSVLYSYDPTSHRVIRNHNPHEAVVNFLKDNGLTFGYATYWNAGVCTVISNYSVEIEAITLDPLQPYDWLSAERWYRPQYHPVGKSFILLEGQERSELSNIIRNSYLGKPQKTLYFADNDILVYAYNIAYKLPGWPK